MRKRDLLKTIGVASATAGFSITAQAGDAIIKEKTLSENKLDKYLNSTPVKRIQDKIGLIFEINPKESTSQHSEPRRSVEITNEPTESHVGIKDKPLIHTVRLETSIGILGIILKEGNVVSSVLGIDKGIGKNWTGNIPDSIIRQEKVQLIFGSQEGAIYARQATDSEVSNIRELDDRDFKNPFVLESNSEIYYRIETSEKLITINASDDKIVHERSITNDDINSDSTSNDSYAVTASSDPCNLPSTKFAACVYDIADTSAYCGLARVACGITGISGPAAIVACLSLIASLCGSRLTLAAVASTCREIADCVDHYCSDPDNICSPTVYPIYP
jgi:hypothetical protein